MVTDTEWSAAPSPAMGGTASGFELVAEVFAEQLRTGVEVGASLAVYVGERCVVDLWGGQADVETERPWERDTRVVVFSVTKALAAMAMHLLAARGDLEWDAPVVRWWPGFGQAGKRGITVRTLLNHQGGVAGLEKRLELADCTRPERRGHVLDIIERQRPLWEPGTDQGYHATTFGLYAGEIFERIAGESMGTFLQRELFEPLGSDARMGTGEEHDVRCATLYPPSTRERVGSMLRAAVEAPESAEGRLMRELPRRRSVARLALSRPSLGPEGVSAYNGIPVRRACLPWASATASAQGIARAFLPFASGGQAGGRRYFPEESLTPIVGRQGWSRRDRVLQKPIGWSQGFMKEERHLFCPNATSFGHSGMGGALGWCDPSTGVSIGYVMNRMDWRIRSPRCLALCRALWECPPLLDARTGG